MFASSHQPDFHMKSANNFIYTRHDHCLHPFPFNDPFLFRMWVVEEGGRGGGAVEEEGGGGGGAVEKEEGWLADDLEDPKSNKKALDKPKTKKKKASDILKAWLLFG
ncbi:hypothetical protein Tco_0053490 [Tanacetum coccineum]